MYLYCLKKRIHVSWLVAIMSIGVVVGVVLAQYTSIWQHTVWIVTGAGLLAVAVWRRRYYVIPCAVIAGLLIGLWRGSLDQSERAFYTPLYHSTVVASGMVSDDVDTTSQGQVAVRLQVVQVNGHEMAGTLWISMASLPDIKRGDRLAVRGTLLPGFGAFVGTIYRANVVRAERPQPGDVARVVRDWFSDHIKQAITAPASALGIGFLVGQKQALSDDLSEALKIAGLTHVVVASGYNLTILVRLARRLFMRVSKYTSTLAASTMIAGFMAVTGASPSMSRAGLVAGLSLAAWYYGRQFHPLVLLPFAAAVTVLINPTYAWGDLGWQLSFASFAGVMIVAPLVQRYFFGDEKPGIVRQIFGETLSAHVVTLPILVVAFGQFSNVALITNMLVLPFVPLAMLLTFVTGLCMIVAPVVTIVGLPAQTLLDYMIDVVMYFSKLPWAQTEMTVPMWAAIVTYAVMVAVCWYLWRATKYDLRQANIVE